MEKQWSLRKGKLDGQKLTFEVPTDDGGVLVFDLTFDGTAVQGTCAQEMWRDDVGQVEFEADDLIWVANAEERVRER